MNSDEKMEKVGKSINSSRKPISFVYAMLVIVVVFGFVAIGLLIYDSPLELMFLLSWVITAPLVMTLGYTYEEVQNMAWESAKQSFEPNVILVVIGCMIAMWISSGTIPWIIYMGLKFINPKFFVVSALVTSSMTSIATGTSWGTLGTAGLALIGVANAMGINPALAAGAIISGAYFGDKMSPLSDSTILAASIAGVPVMKHVKHMIFTTGPAYIISAILFTILGSRDFSGNVNLEMTNEIMTSFDSIFKFSGIEVIPIIIVVALLIKQVPSIISLLIGTITGFLISAFSKGFLVGELLQFMVSGFEINSGSQFIDKLLNRGGINSMMGAYLAIFFALCISGMLEKSGILDVIIKPVLERCRKSNFKIILYTIILTYITNAIGSSMLFASIVTGTLMKPVYIEKELDLVNLSRTLEDAGTLGAVLIPWNSNAIYASQMLGVSPFSFMPFCFLNYITPIIAIIYAKLGIFLGKSSKKEILEK